MRSFKGFLIIFFLIFSLVVKAQELPPITSFSPTVYKGEDQNWSVDISSDGFVYVANNSGLLIFDGETWRKYNSPNDAILRSVKSIGSKIYSGGYMDFGFWEKDELGNLEYTSLVKKYNVNVIEDEEFWKIIELEGYVLFQSLNKIHIYNVNERKFNVISSENRINKIFKVNNEIYFQIREEGLFKIIDGVSTLILDNNVFDGTKLEIINIYNNKDRLLIQTKEHGLFILDAFNGIDKWDIPANDRLNDVSVYNSIALQNGNFALGTISNGLIILSNTGEIILELNQSDGLINNTVLSLVEDEHRNLFLGLDNGFTIVNLNNSVKVFKDKFGQLGTIYDIQSNDNTLYLGTNQGLFSRSLKNSNEPFKLIEGTNGQVWNIHVFNNQMFCSHDKGLFVINESRADLISELSGTWQIKPIPNTKDLFLAGTYKGLELLYKKDNVWKTKRLEGFSNSSRFIEFVDKTTLLISHEYKGVFKLKLNNDFLKVQSFENIKQPNGPNSSIVKFNNDILFQDQEGIHFYNKSESKFELNTTISEVLKTDTYISGSMSFNSIDNKLWLFTKDNIISIKKDGLGDNFIFQKISMSSVVRKNKIGYENVYPIDQNNIILGNKEGYLYLNLEKENIDEIKVSINNILFNTKHKFNQSENTQLKHKYNDIGFSYSILNYNKINTVQYQYTIPGFYEDWSSWSNQSKVYFENLPYGEYVFKVRARVNGQVSENIATYNFTIAKPWYRSGIAIFAYVVLFIIILFVVHILNKRHYKKQKDRLILKKQRELELEQLKNKQQLIEFKNSNLKLDIENKSKELGSVTMNLVKRNELLNKLKEELLKLSDLKDINKVVKLINSNINNTGDWNTFERAFNNVDKDFMKKLKEIHPTITPNDLRLCAYLRLNLSSKEIAPLLNISHKSVEVKRYRLRKKMNLDHNQSLTDYILSV